MLYVAAQTPMDFRSTFYRGYVSTFKGHPELASQAAFDWWDRKYLPLLGGLDSTTPILEIGCGSGGLLAYLARRGFSRAFGIDASAEQVELAKKRGVSVEHADALEFLVDHKTEFGAVLAVDVFEHLTRDELLRLAPLIHAALSPGGRLVIQTANGAGLFAGQVIYGDLTHMTIFTPQSLGQLLHAAGFTGLSMHETGPTPVRLRGKIDVALWLAIKTVANAVRSIEAGKRQTIWTDNFICRAFKPD